MTNLQIQYWSLEETIRHDKATERETKRRNLATEALTLKEIEVKRYAAGASYAAVAETAKHNRETERIQAMLAESQVKVQQAQADLIGAQVTTETARADYVKSQTDLLNAQVVTERIRALETVVKGILEYNEIALKQSQTAVNNLEAQLKAIDLEIKQSTMDTSIFSQNVGNIAEVSRNVDEMIATWFRRDKPVTTKKTYHSINVNGIISGSEETITIGGNKRVSK